MNKVSVIAALPVEGRCLSVRTIKPGLSYPVNTTTRLRVSGIGRDNARNAARTMLAEQETMLLISWGVAAALEPNARAGDLILADAVSDRSGTSYPVTADVLQQFETFAGQNAITKIDKGSLTEAVDILPDRAAKSELYAHTGAIAADMESAAIAAVAQEAGIEFLAIRVISDDFETSVPAAASRNMDAFGNIHLPGLVMSLLRRPADIRSLYRLAYGFRQARKTLITCAAFLEAR